MKKFVNYTSYTQAEDLKRLGFIISATEEKPEQDIEILEIGCGNGNICYQLAMMGYRVTGIDVSAETIENASRKHKAERLRFEHRSAEQVESDKKYDVIVCSEVIEHLHDPDVVVSHFDKILKDGGRVIVTVPNGRGPREALMTRPVQNAINRNDWKWKTISWIKKLLGYSGTTIQSSASNLTHIQFFSKKDVYRLADKSGFRIIRFGTSNFLEKVFPFSLLVKLIPPLQKFDCIVADIIPHSWASGFMTVWVRK